MTGLEVIQRVNLEVAKLAPASTQEADASFMARDEQRAYRTDLRVLQIGYGCS
jgi:hypothetical protein